MVENCSENEQQAGQEPFILSFLEHYEGAMAGTTSGTYNHIDGADYD
jgi:hypothetical protein|tara:strand:- start:383 stop:523 length:141 start_codon:yes stop_codon:yes gene_type:complete